MKRCENPARATPGSRVAPRRGAWIETPLLIFWSLRISVAPRRGAWIETMTAMSAHLPWRVAPRRGAWIETVENLYTEIQLGGRTPQGCVD